MNMDPIAEEYNYMTPYQFASNNPVWNVELEGLEGIKFQEVDKNGKFIRHVVKLKVAVLTVKSLDKDFKKTLTAKEIRNRVTSSFQNSDVKKIDGILNRIYNGDEGGRQNSKGETVFFKFEVQELNVGATEKTNEMSLKAIAKSSGIESGEVNYMDQATGQEVFKKSPMNIIQGTRSENSNARGENDQIITRVPENDKNFNQAVGHETAHQFLQGTPAEDHSLISNFGLELTPKVIDAILDDAYLDKKPIQTNSR